MTSTGREAAPRSGRYLLSAGLTLAVLAAVGLRAAIAERRASLLAATEARLAALAVGKAETLAAWLEGTARLGNRLTRSEVVQLFVAEAALAAQDASLNAALVGQVPYMRRVVDAFAAQHDLAGVHLLNADLDRVIADRDAPALLASQRDAVATFLDGKDAWTPLAPRVDQGGAVVDLILRIPAPQTLNGNPSRAGALLMTPRADALLKRVLAPSGLDGETARLRLVDADLAVRDGPLTRLEDLAPVARGGLRPIETANGTALALAAPLPGTDWSLVQSVDGAAALRPLVRFERVATAFAIGGGFLIATAFLLVWQRQRARHLGDMAEQYRVLAAEIQRQRRLLQTVTDASLDLIGLKDRRGRYVFANPAFAEAVRRPVDWLLDREDEEVFAPATAARLAEGEALAIGSGAALREEQFVEIAGRERHLNLVQVPITDAEDTVFGMLVVARDVGDLVRERRQREAMTEQTVAALVRAVELSDSYLLGHTRRLRGVALDLADALHLLPEERRRLELAAGLSQVGKVFVPRAIAAKPGRHTPKEARTMQSHVAHALPVVEGIDFDGLPVALTLGQMHERLDGTGYPRGLAGDAIGRLGRILAVADVYCARTAPRGYRGAIEPEKALDILRSQPGRYDPAVVAALAGLVGSVEHAPV